MEPFIRRWFWACLYLFFLYATLPFVGPATDWANSNEFQWFVAYAAPALLAAAGLGVLLAAVRRPEGRPGVAVLLLAGAVVFYYLLATRLMEAAVERFHMLLFAGLSLLVYRAFRQTTRGARVYLYTVVFLLCAGFVDEMIQGFMNDRLYDNRDILLNVASGLPAMILYGALSVTPRRNLPPPALRRDLAGAGLLLLLGLAMFFLRRTPLAPDMLAGTWQAAGDCGGMNRIVFGRNGEIEWNDDAGNWSRGRLSAVGNPFGEHRLYIRIDEAKNRTPCGLQKGWRGSMPLRFGEGFFTLYRNPKQWKRVVPGVPD